MNPTESGSGKHSRRKHSCRKLDDEGSVTVIGAAVILGIIACCLLIVQAAVAVVGQHRAVAGADLVAVSAATVLLSAGEQQACAGAAQVADANDAELVSCGTVDGSATSHGTPGVAGMAVKVKVVSRETTATAGPVDQ